MFDTKGANNIMSCYGRAMYNHKLHLANNTPKDVATFSSSFTFRFSSKDSPYIGDGFAFVIASYATSIGGIGGHLALVTSTTNGRVTNHLVGIERHNHYLPFS